MGRQHDPVGPLDSLRRRHPSDVGRVAIGLLALVVASLPVRPDEIGRIETGAFAVVNGLPDVLYPVLWVPMQLGSLVAVPVVAVAALLTRRRWLAVEAAVSGSLAWVLAKVVKDAYGRPRPGGLLDDVVFRGGEPVGFGFVSGHTAVAFALATAATLYLPRRWRSRVYVLALVVGVARMFVGAHLPLDVVGGAGLGWAIAAAVRLVGGAATGRPTLDRVRAGLDVLGLGVVAVQPLAAPAGTSAGFRLSREAGGELFAKVLSDRPQDRDLLYRWWLVISRRVPRGSRRFASPSLQVEFEATRTLKAALAGARVPGVLYAGPLDGENAVLITTWVSGRTLSSLADAGPAVTREVQAQVQRLHAGRIAHGDLVGANILVDGDDVTLVDFGNATLLADDATIAVDEGQMAVLVPGG